MNRLDFCWKRQLLAEQDEATTTRKVNKMLLQNILPEHVGKLNNKNSHIYNTSDHTSLNYIFNAAFRMGYYSQYLQGKNKQSCLKYL